MRAWTAIAGALVALSAGGSRAAADIPIPPQPLWGTPAPRSIATPDGRRPTPLPPALSWRSEALEEPLRDPDVAMRSERVSLVFLRNLVWVRSTIVLRAERPVADWPMGIALHQQRTPGLPVFALEVQRDGEAVPIHERTLPVGQSELDPRPGHDAWLEWRVDLPAGRDVALEVSYLVPATWMAAGEDGSPSLDAPSAPRGYVLWFDYQLSPGRRYASGRGRARVDARVVGHRASFLRVRSEGSEELGERASFRLEPDEERVRLAVAWPSPTPPARAARLGGEVPAWIALLDRWLFAFPFEPTLGRSIAEQHDAADFARMVEELRERAEHARDRERDVARGLLTALRERLAGTVDAPEDVDPFPSFEEEGPLPSARQLGVLGGELDEEEWREAVDGARRWLLPAGESLEPLPERSRRLGKGRRWAEPASGDEQLRLLSPPREATDSARDLDLREEARALGHVLGPPFGFPNQLVAASKTRDGGLAWTLAPGAALALAVLLAVRRVRARRRAHALGTERRVEETG